MTVVTFALADQWGPARLDSLVPHPLLCLQTAWSPVVTPFSQQLWKTQLGTNLLLPSQLWVSPARLHGVLQTLLAGVGRTEVRRSSDDNDNYLNLAGSGKGLVCSDFTAFGMLTQQKVLLWCDLTCWSLKNVAYGAYANNKYLYINKYVFINCICSMCIHSCTDTPVSCIISISANCFCVCQLRTQKNKNIEKECLILSYFPTCTIIVLLITINY